MVGCQLRAFPPLAEDRRVPLNTHMVAQSDL